MKCSADGKLRKQKLKKYKEFWNEARIILVSSKEPYFQICYIKSFMKDEKMWRLEKDRYTSIDPNVIKKFSEIVKEYFKE